MAKTNKPRITFKKRWECAESFTIIANGKVLTRSTDGDESWVNFSYSEFYRCYMCDVFFYVNDRLLTANLQASRDTIPDTLKALRPIIQQAIINGELQVAGAPSETKSE